MARKVAIPLAIFALFVMVIVQNSAPVTVNFLFWDAQVPLVVLLVGWSFGGFLCGAGFVWAVSREKPRPVTEGTPPGTGS